MSHHVTPLLNPFLVYLILYMGHSWTWYFVVDEDLDDTVDMMRLMLVEDFVIYLGNVDTKEVF